MLQKQEGSKEVNICKCGCKTSLLNSKRNYIFGHQNIGRKKRPHTEETKLKISLKKRDTKPWNLNLTKEIDERLMKISNNLKENLIKNNLEECKKIIMEEIKMGNNSLNLLGGNEK